MLKYVLQQALYQLGYQLVRNTRPPIHVGFSHGDVAALPAGYQMRLRGDNPRLIDLRARYKQCQLPMATHSWWNEEYIAENLDLQHFRGDNAYVWQTRQMGESAVQRYYLYLREVESRDSLGLMSRLKEDGAFGCWVYKYHRNPAVSRDLLDSINEINFLERNTNISSKASLSILDIGAGYGRMAHRCCEALPNLTDYFCVDAVPESTFLAETYVDYRNCGEKVCVIALDELDKLNAKTIDIAINTHSFSEMSLAAIEGWLDLIERLNVSRLFVIPNDPEAFLTMEVDGTRKNYLPSIEKRGYYQMAKEPVISDHDIRELVGTQDHMFLFTRKS